MANLSLLYSNEIVAGLKVKAAHLKANFLQLITRSNLQDSQIADLQSANTGLTGRVSTTESEISTLTTNVDGLLERFPAAADMAIATPYTVDFTKPNVFVPAGGYGTTVPEITVPKPDDLPYGSVVTIASDRGSELITISVKQYNDGSTDTIKLRGGGYVRLEVVKDYSGTPTTMIPRWEVVSSSGIVRSWLEFTDEDGSLEPSNVTDYSGISITATSGNRTLTLPKISRSGADPILVRAYTTTIRHVMVVEHASDGGSTVIDHSGSGLTTWYELRPEYDGSAWKYRSITWS